MVSLKVVQHRVLPQNGGDDVGQLVFAGIFAFLGLV